MSEKIKITIVTDDEKQNTESDSKVETAVTLTHDSSMALMSTLLQNDLLDGSFCGGRGECGRCMVQFLKGAPLPTPLERNRMEPEELRRGLRFSCLARPKDDCVIKLMFPKEPEIEIVTGMIDLSEDVDYISQSKRSSVKRKVDVMKKTDADDKGIMKDSYIVAVDLGTTTMAMQLRIRDTGEVVDTYCEMNPQRKYGSDVLSRIQASGEGHAEALRQCVWEVLERGVYKFIESVKPEAIDCICLAGNTTMAHLFMGYDVSSLGRSPFTPVEIGLQACVGPLKIPIYITPGISAFVGGDIVAGLYVLKLLMEERTRKDSGDGMASPGEKVRLLIDLGTNGEMAITDGAKMLVTATAAGPAFEGGTSKVVVGTDMIALTALLHKQGILDETGLLKEPYFTKGVTLHTKKGDVSLENRDIRALQMAKAAVRAGVEILWEQMGRPKIGQVYLAGGFGYYLDVEAALSIGLLPEHLRGSVQAVGNTSLEGAFQIGRDLCLGITDKHSLEDGLTQVQSINLAKQEEFESLYLQYMNLDRN